MAQSQVVVEELYDLYTKTAANIVFYYGSNERKEKLKDLRDIVKTNCILDAKLKQAEEVKNRLLNLYDDDADRDIEAVIEEYKQAIAEIHTDPLKENKLLEYDRQVAALCTENGNDEDNSDDEMQLTGGYINVIDPISKKRIVDPVKNTLCGHTYDRDTITQLLKINKKTRCPVMGCKTTDFVTLAHLRTDIVTKTFLDKNPAN